MTEEWKTRDGGSALSQRDYILQPWVASSELPREKPEQIDANLKEVAPVLQDVIAIRVQFVREGIENKRRNSLGVEGLLEM